MDLKGIIFLLLAIIFGFLYFKSAMAGNPYEKELSETKRKLKSEKESADRFIADQKKAYEDIIKKIKAGTPAEDKKPNDNTVKLSDITASAADVAYFKNLNDENRKRHVEQLMNLRGRIDTIHKKILPLFDAAFEAKKRDEALFLADLLQVVDPENEITQRVLNRVKEFK